MRIVLEPRCPKSIHDEEEEEDHSQICTGRNRFGFAYDELYLSDDESDDEPECMMNNKVINDHQTKIKEDVRNQVSVLETELMNEIKKYRSSIARVEKYHENRREVERKLDLYYQQEVAEALDTHLTAIQREHDEAKSQIEERKIRQEKVKTVIERVSVVGSSDTWNARDTEGVLALEKQRLKKLEELEAMNQLIKSRLNKDLSSFEKRIGRKIRQITAVKDIASKKSNEIVRIFKDPRCPLSISIATFAKKMVSSRQNPFACSYVIVYVTSYFPQAMDILLAEFHKACIYTVPKHCVNSQLAWDSDAYERLDSIMRLYGALVQTDIRGGNVTNVHGIEHGWAWLARFLNKISANNNIAAATALNAFLQTAGFGLHQRYKSQFVNVLREQLRAKEVLQWIIAKITVYLDDGMYLKEPEGRTMKDESLVSGVNC